MMFIEKPTLRLQAKVLHNGKKYEIDACCNVSQYDNNHAKVAFTRGDFIYYVLGDGYGEEDMAKWLINSFIDGKDTLGMVKELPDA